MSNYDFRDQEPIWVRYAEKIDHRSNKYYEVRVDLADDGNFVVTRRWGARPDLGKGQIKTEAYARQQTAQATANNYLSAKISRGYDVRHERPLSASGLVTQDWSDEDDF